jgi:hypothetical protein
MKSNLIHTPIIVDRMATADEIRAAALPASDRLEEEEGTSEMFHEFPLDTGGYVRISGAEFEIASMVAEMTREKCT